MRLGNVVHDHVIGPVLGVAVIVAMAGAVTVACFVAMIRMLLRPGEADHHHPKYEVLRDDG
jgi:hypothetical protein